MIRDLAIMLLAGGVIRTGSKRVNVLTVVGEIVAGIAIGPSIFKWVAFSSDIDHVAKIGVMLLLFNAGMHINIRELVTVGRSSFNVAIIGVALPLLGGIFAGFLFGESRNTSLFIGAALAATSIGITARVFTDLHELHSTNARVVLGAAVIDDVLGLIILAIASFVVKSGTFSPSQLIDSALVIGSFLLGALMSGSSQKERVPRSLTPFNQVFILLFFVSIGLRADISKVATTKGIALIVVLFAVAIASKYLAGYSARQPNVDQALIGIGMIPRGEVGLIFANTAVGLHVFNSTTYSSVVVVVLLTTVVAPTLLRRRIEFLKTST